MASLCQQTTSGEVSATVTIGAVDSASAVSDMIGLHTHCLPLAWRYNIPFLSCLQELQAHQLPGTRLQCSFGPKVSDQLLHTFSRNFPTDVFSRNAHSMAGRLVSSWHTLPPEILQEIVQHLSGEDLKQARLASRWLNHACIAPLFREICLVPFQSCLDRFIDLLLASTKLGRYIHKFTYDDRWHAEFWDFCQNLEPVEDGATKNVLETFHDPESIARWPSKEIERLDTIFSYLPKLVQVRVFECGELRPDDRDLPSFLKHYTRELSDGQHDTTKNVNNWDVCIFERTATRAVLRAMTKKDSVNFQRLVVRGMNFSHSKDQKVHIEPLLSLQSLRELDLTFLMRYPTRFDEDYCPSEFVEVASSLNGALSQASNLQSLRLRGFARQGRPGTYCDGREPLIKMLVDDQALFPHLSALSIQDTPMDARNLSVFLQRHHGALRRLELRNIIQVPTQADCYRDCLVSLLYRIRDMGLDYFSFGGVLSNGGKQVWHFQDRYDLATQSDDFIKERNRSFGSSLHGRGYGNPGYGVNVGGQRYPSIDNSRWFDDSAARSIEMWVLEKNDSRPCPMDRFAKQPGDGDFSPALEERGRGWHLYIWRKEVWDFEYRGAEAIESSPRIYLR